MPFNLVTLLGFSSLLAWLHTSNYLLLAHDPAVHNGSAAACAAFAVALLLSAPLNRLLASGPRRRLLLGAGVLAGGCGIGYALAGGDGMRLLFFCLQMGCGALIVVSWGERLSSLCYGALVPLACAAGLCSAAVLLICSLSGPVAAPLAVITLPVCTGACLFAALSENHPEAAGSLARAERAGRGASLVTGPSVSASLRRLPWMLATVLCLCTFAASLFGGLTTNPFLANSSTVTFCMLGLTAAGLVTMGARGRLCLAPRGGETEEGEDMRPRSLMQAMTALTLILLVGGLLLFSIKLPGTMTTALGMVLGAKNCLVVICWIVFTREIAEARLPFAPCFALLILASGTLYAPYLGAWVNKSLGVGFETLTGMATVAIAFVAVLAILYMVGRMRQMGAEQRSLEKAAAEAEPLTLEDIREALRAHRLALLEPYGLTERERQIVSMIADGQTLGGIAEELFITERTVKFHSKNAYDKLGVHGKKELMRMLSEPQGDESTGRREGRQKP